jgi:hypothetical protein
VTRARRNVDALRRQIEPKRPEALNNIDRKQRIDFLRRRADALEIR